MAIFWNTHARITPEVAQAHISELLSLSPPPPLPSPIAPTPPVTSTHPRPALDTPDEHALRALLLGITHRAAGFPAESRRFLRDAHARHARIPSTGSSWIGGVALFELAVLELREAQRLEHEHERESEPSHSGSGSSEEEEGYGGRELRLRVDALSLGLDGPSRVRWDKVLKDATALLDSAMSLSGSEVDLSSRLESRIAMLRDEIALKREMLGGH
jgi:hypothetical protein